MEIFNRIILDSFHDTRKLYLNKGTTLPFDIDVAEDYTKKIIERIYILCDGISQLNLNVSTPGVFITKDYNITEELISVINTLPNEIKKEITSGWVGVSSGEFAKLNLFSEIYNYLNDYDVHNKNINLIFIDEADLYLHPEWQRRFLFDLLNLLEKYASTKNIQFIITSHSPIIISDFLPENIISLYQDSENTTYVGKSLGFGTNITNLFVDGMHISSTFGEHSRVAVNELLNRFKNNNLTEEDKFLITQIGNEHMREYLEDNDIL